MSLDRQRLCRVLGDGVGLGGESVVEQERWCRP